MNATETGQSVTGLNWYVNNVQNGNSTQGTLTACTTVAPLHCTYTAPSINVPSPNPVTFKIVATQDGVTSKTATATVTDSIAVTLSPTSASLQLSGTHVFTATLSGTTNAGLIWSVNRVVNGNSTQGTLTGCTTVAPRTCKYTAPPVNVPSPNPAVIKVASAADPGKYKSANLTVTDSIAVTISPTVKSLALSGTQVFTATITGATTNSALNWYVNGVLNGSASQGKLTACTTVAPLTCTYTAPPVNVPRPNPAVIKVASSAEPGKFKTANVTVTDSIAVTLAPTSASLPLSGTQVFTATLSGTTNAGLIWSVNGVVNGNSAQGTLGGCTSVAPRTCLYTAPPVNVPSPNPAVIKVASAADPGKYKSANLTVTDSIAVTLAPTSASLPLSGTKIFTASISNTTNTALNWYVNGVLNGNAALGTLTACTTVAPRTCKYTAPPVNVPSPNPAAIKVASAADPAKFKTANVTVTNPVPSITGLSPSSATAGAAAQTLTINGTNFLSSSMVTYNSVAHTATFVNSTQLTISVSASDQAAAGVYPVVVANPAPGGGASNAVNFPVKNPPSITSLSPPSANAGGSAFTLTVNGSNFISSSKVHWNGSSRTTSYVNDAQLTASINAADITTTGSVNITVVNPALQAGRPQQPASPYIPQFRPARSLWLPTAVTPIPARSTSRILRSNIAPRPSRVERPAKCAPGLTVKRLRPTLESPSRLMMASPSPLTVPIR